MSESNPMPPAPAGADQPEILPAWRPWRQP